MEAFDTPKSPEEEYIGEAVAISTAKYLLIAQFDQLRTKKDLLDKPQYGNEKQIDKNICDQQERYDIIKQIKIYDDHQIDFPNILSHIKHTKVIDFFFENICKVNLKLDNKNKISKAYSKIFNDSSTLSLDHSKREEFWENLKNNSSS
ncbi:unnamed protein product [Gordionus sp. m RMFG-2023]